MTEKLLPCPFCGGEAEIISRPVYTYLKPYDPETADKKHYVQCKGCATQCGALEYDTPEEAITAWNRRAQPENKPLTRCADCEHWDKSISFMLSAHACAYWSPSRENPRYTEGFEFCSFARSKPEEEKI